MIVFIAVVFGTARDNEVDVVLSFGRFNYQFTKRCYLSLFLSSFDILDKVSVLICNVILATINCNCRD